MDASKKRKADENGTGFDASSDAVSQPKALTREIARDILEPLTKEQLIEVLQDVVVRGHGDVLDAVRLVADADPAKRKLFVRGLGWETNTEKLRGVFSAFGELEEAIVITDKNTGKTKGYGFVTFRHIDGALLALKEPSKKIDGRMTVTQLAASGVSGANAANGVDVSQRKIYVGNVPFEITSERLLDHFSMYGEIEEGPLGFDMQQAGKPRGFAFFIYRTEEGARASLVEPMKVIDGHQVTCKLAVDGKRGKTGGVQAPGGGGVPGDGNRLGMGPPGSMPLNSNYGVPGGMPSYGGFSGGPPPAMAQQNPNMNTAPIGGQGYGNQGPSPMGAAGGYGAYGGSQYGGSGSGEYGGLNSTGSSMYRLPPSSMGMPSGGYPDSGNYGVSSSAYPMQHQQHQQQPPAAGPRVPPGPGGMYQGMPPYY